jgi:hypothetical protein
MLFNHPTLGDIQNFVYLKGKVLRVYLEDPAIDPSFWDTADIEYENHKVFSHAKVRYHCQAVGIERANGAVVDGGRGFDVDDEVILMAKIGSTPHMGEEYEQMYVVSHLNGTVPCTYNYLLVRVSATALKPHAPPYGVWREGVYVPTEPGSHSKEYCMVWDTTKGLPATIYNPSTGIPYVFPVTVEEFKPALDYYAFTDEELFVLASQGDAQSQEAGFTPNWTADLQGNLIRGDAPADAWWTTYDINANPIFELFSKIQTALALDNVGASTGAFTASMAKLAAGKENIDRWKAASPLAFNDDTRSFDVKGSGDTYVMPAETQARLQVLQGTVAQMNDAISNLDSAKIARWENLQTWDLSPVPSDTAEEARRVLLRAELVELSGSVTIRSYQYLKRVRDTAQLEIDGILGQSVFTPWPIAHDKNGNLLKGSSYHLQTAYGEDEIWACAKNIYQGMVVAYCDAAWKFVRMREIPPVVPITNTGLERLMGSNVTPGTAGLTMGQMMADISFALASAITVGQDNNIFSIGTLKRINDGGFHRTTHPALKTEGIGSWRMTQRAIPHSNEPVFITALNSRKESIDVWNRYDNWMNSIQYSAASYGTDRTWWFRSNAQQWRINANFIDTPIGSMWYYSPTWEVALWYMSGFSIFDGGPICRRDAPVRTTFTRQTRHTRRVVAQIYIVQRQAVTQWDDPTRTFVVQQLNKGIYDHFVPADIKYVDKDGDGLKNDDYTTLTAEQQKAQLSDRVYVRSTYTGEVGYVPPAALRANRNEIEIMAACDLYSTLKTNFGQCNPSKQVRNGRLEQEIEKLLQLYHTSEGLGIKDFSEFKLEARII